VEGIDFGNAIGGKYFNREVKGSANCEKFVDAWGENYRNVGMRGSIDGIYRVREPDRRDS